MLNKILRIQGLKSFLRKLIYVDRETLALRFKYELLSSLSNGEYKLLDNHDSDKDSYQICIYLKERDKYRINIYVSFPTLETIKYNNQNYEDCFESDYDTISCEGISLDILDELCKKDFEEWANILLKISS